MIDRNTIKRLEELSPEGEDLVGELIQVFAAETPRSIADMKRALAMGDLASLKRVAHVLKSSSANLGAMNMRELSEKIEKSSPAGDRALLNTLVESLERDFETSLHELRELH